MQPIQWSCEFFDDELGLIYYNYRHYNPTYSLWLSRDPIGEIGGLHLYISRGMPMCFSDYLGLTSLPNRKKGRNNRNGLSCAEKVQMKIQKLQNIITKYSSSSKQKCLKNGCTLITILVEVGYPCGDWISKEVGHTAMGIGNEFHDLGPSERVNRFGYASGSSPYWELNGREVKELNQAIKNIDILAENPVVSIEFCACMEKTQKARDYWNDPYNHSY